MARIRSIIFGVLLLATVAGAASFTGKIVKVTDGDTIQVLRDRVPVKVRLWGIDCPEKAQAFGHKATQYTRDLAGAATVTVHVKDTDRYGRTVGEVILPDGRSLNRELVRAGLAWWYRRYAPGDSELQRLEREARETKRGLWADRAAVPPWDWRRAKRHGHGR